MAEDKGDGYSIYEDEQAFNKTISDHYNLAALSFIICAALILPAFILAANSFSKLCNRKVSLHLYHQTVYMWITISCLLLSVLDILNLFDNILNKNKRMKSGRSCYFIYVFEGTLTNSIAISLCSVVVDILLNILGWGKLCFYNQGKPRLALLLFFAYIIVFFILNDLPDITGHMAPSYVITCWKGVAHGYHLKFIGQLDLVLQILLITAMIILCALTIYHMHSRILLNKMVITPEHILAANIADVEEEEIVVVSSNESESRSKDLEIPEAEISDTLSKGAQKRAVFRNHSMEYRNEEKKHLRGSKKLFRCSSHTIRRDKIHPDKGSSESSGHTNSGYMSDGCEDPVEIKPNLLKQRTAASKKLLGSELGTNALHKGRKRFKSDSDIQKNQKLSFKKNLEEHVLYALDNFFTVEPSHLVPLPKITLHKCELSENLITDDDDTDVNTDNPDDKVIDSDENEDETSFMGGQSSYVPLEVKYEQPDSHTKEGEEEFGVSEINDDNLKNEAEMKQEEDQEEYNTALTTKGHHVNLIQRSVSESGYTTMETFRDDWPSKLVQEELVQEQVKPILTYDFEQLNESVEDETFEEKETRIVPDVVISVNADVHSIQPDQDACTGGDSDKAGDHTNSRNKTFSNSSILSQGSRLEKQVRWNNQIPDINIELETVKCVDTQEVAYENKGLCVDMPMPMCSKCNSIADLSEEQQADTKENKDNEAMHDRNVWRMSDDIKMVRSSRRAGSKKKKEVLTFIEYSRKYLIKPFKDVMCLMLTYIICMMPQITLDLYRTMRSDVAPLDYVDGVLSILSDVSMSLFLLAISVVSLWRFQKKRRTKVSNNVHWLLQA